MLLLKVFFFERETRVYIYIYIYICTLLLLSAHSRITDCARGENNGRVCRSAGADGGESRVRGGEVNGGFIGSQSVKFVLLRTASPPPPPPVITDNKFERARNKKSSRRSVLIEIFRRGISSVNICKAASLQLSYK